MKNHQDLTKGSINNHLVRLSLPMMLGIISMVAFNLVDTYFVGQLGTDQLAALSFTFPVITVVFSIVQGLGIGATALVARSIGTGNFDKAARETTDSLFLGVLIGGLFILIGWFSITPTFRLLGVREQILPYVVEYMEVWYLAILFIVVPFIGNSAIRASGDAMTPTLIMLFAVVINAILDPILIFGWGPVSAMGLKGAAIATALSRGTTLLLSLYVLYFKKKLITFAIPTWLVLKGCWRSILYIGVPSGLSRMIVPMTMAFITAMLAKHGEAAVAAFGVGSRIDFLALSLLIAISASVGPFTGQNLGAMNIDRIKAFLKTGNIFSLFWGLIVWMLLLAFAREVSNVFTKEAEVVRWSTTYLMILPISYGFQGITQIVNSNLNTINKPIQASLLMVFQMIVIGIPLILLGDYLRQIEGIFYALSATYLLGGIISLAVNRSQVNRLSSG